MKVFSTSWLSVGGRFGFLVGLLLAAGLNVAPASAQTPSLTTIFPTRNGRLAVLAGWTCETALHLRLPPAADALGSKPRVAIVPAPESPRWVGKPRTSTTSATSPR